MPSPIEALIKNYQRGNDADALLNDLKPLFQSNEAFLSKVKQFDELFNDFPAFADIKEYAFDLMMSNHLELHQSTEDYFDTKEWLDIEDKTLERGTELLNLLLYITEAKDEDISMNLEDFLHEFLLVDDDEFQDEYIIYESFISNSELVTVDEQAIIEACKDIDTNEEMRDFLAPVFLFFHNPKTSPSSAVITQLLPVEAALYACLLAFTNR